MKQQIIEISKHLNEANKNWFGTILDSQMTFKETWYNVDKEILNKYFEIGNNGGSYSINFDSKNLEEILEKLKIDFKNIRYLLIDESGVFPNKVQVPKKAYLDYIATEDRDEFSEWLAPYFQNM